MAPLVTLVLLGLLSLSGLDAVQRECPLLPFPLPPARPCPARSHWALTPYPPVPIPRFGGVARGFLSGCGGGGGVWSGEGCEPRTPASPGLGEGTSGTLAPGGSGQSDRGVGGVLFRWFAGPLASPAQRERRAGWRVPKGWVGGCEWVETTRGLWGSRRQGVSVRWEPEGLELPPGARQVQLPLCTFPKSATTKPRRGSCTRLLWNVLRCLYSTSRRSFSCSRYLSLLIIIIELPVGGLLTCAMCCMSFNCEMRLRCKQGAFIISLS